MAEKIISVIGEKDEITLKEVYERLIQLEAKFDLTVDTNKQDIHYFRNTVILLVVVGFLNSVLNIIQLILNVFN